MIDTNEVLEQIREKEKRLTPAAEELRQRLNEVIAHYQLDGDSVIDMLARISAGYIIKLQQAYNKADYYEVVEERFQDILNIYLTSFDMEQVNKEVEKIRREELN